MKYRPRRNTEKIGSKEYEVQQLHLLADCAEQVCQKLHVHIRCSVQKSKDRVMNTTILDEELIPSMFITTSSLPLSIVQLLMTSTHQAKCTSENHLQPTSKQPAPTKASHEPRSHPATMPILAPFAQRRVMWLSLLFIILRFLLLHPMPLLQPICDPLRIRVVQSRLTQEIAPLAPLMIHTRVISPSRI